MFIGITKPQTAVDDLYWFGVDENWQPVNNGESDKVNEDAIDEFVAIHIAIIVDKGWCWVGISGDLMEVGMRFQEETWRSRPLRNLNANPC